MVRKDDAVLPTPPTKIQEVAAVAPSSTSVQVGPQAVVPCACLGKSPRRWKSVDEVFGWPIGVYAFKTSAKTVVRYHALFAAVPRRQELIGCFATKEEAAVAWDTRRGVVGGRFSTVQVRQDVFPRAFTCVLSSQAPRWRGSHMLLSTQAGGRRSCRSF